MQCKWGLILPRCEVQGAGIALTRSLFASSLRDGDNLWRWKAKERERELQAGAVERVVV